jgi:hypothetical protein
MVRNKLMLFILLLIVLQIGCNSNNSIKQLNKHLAEQKSTFGRDFTIDGLFNHFPQLVSINKVKTIYFPPSCLPTSECRAQFGDMVYILNKSVYQEELSRLYEGEIAYKSAYTDTNIIINLIELRKDIYPVEKCNYWFADKFPIPYFESYDFGLGEVKTKVETYGEPPYFIHTHQIPLDLQVFVIHAEAGSFWIEDCNETRPESIKEWKNGYSRGFAVSEKENILVYWVMIW